MFKRAGELCPLRASGLSEIYNIYYPEKPGCPACVVPARVGRMFGKVGSRAELSSNYYSYYYYYY